MHYYAPYLCIITNERQRNANPAFRNAFWGILCAKKEDPDYPVPDLLQAFPPLCKQNGQACVNSPPPQRRDDFLRITSPKTITFS